MNRWPTISLKGYIMEVSIRKGNIPTDVLSITNTGGFVRSLEVFDKQVFSQDTSNYKLVRFDDLAYNPSRINVGSVARCHFPEGGAVSPMYVVVQCRKSLLPQFLLYFLKSDIGKQHINHRCVGAVRFQLRFSDLEKIELPLPPVSEQKQIVRTLDEAEALRRLRGQADHRTRDIESALFNELFGDPSNPKRWPVIEVSRFVRRFEAGRSIAPSGEDDMVSKYRILKVSAVTWGKFSPEESKPIADSYTPTPEQLVRSGDMLFSRANATELVGATVLVDETPENLLLPDKLWRFVWQDPDQVEPRFVLSLFQHPSIRRELSNRATGTGGSMKNISMDKVMTMKVPFPAIDLQRAFAARVAEIRALETAQAASRKRLDDLFQSLLHRAFQGEL